MYINVTHPLPAQKSDKVVSRAREKNTDKTFADIVETALAVDSVDLDGERRNPEHKPAKKEKKEEPKKDGLDVTV